ncbi:MAG: penicillin-binding protein 1A, partial [Armatimonadetes bacterium]|nr:penicillin-binding protein 1A [Armatimonadota bacterium]
DGVVLAEVFEENREFVKLDDIPKALQDATIAIEDSRFYKHIGIDLKGIARALYQNLRKKEISQGGSTITQQLARNIYLTREKTLSRKLQEVVLALQLERNFSKQQILELYLNEVYYGSGACGVQAASKVYFGKEVKNLTLSQCALIAGLPQKPSVYSPHENLDLAIKRRNVVLDRMAELGYITEEQCEQAKREKPKIVPRKPTGIARYKAPWFVTYVIQQLSDEFGADLVYRGGLRVYTTLNYEMQKAAEEALREGVRSAKYLNVTQGALVCIEPQNGYIRAMVGGVNPDFTKDQYNRVVQARRQPGSAFKAFVYTAAIDNGYDPDYRISNARISFPGYGGKTWSPRNYDGRYGGSYTIRRAIAQSVNICAVRMANEIGIDKVIAYAGMLGIKSPLTRSLALALGASDVTPLEICSAYGVFAANGVRAEPMAVVRITTCEAGREEAVIAEYAPTTIRVLSQETARIMNDLFRGVVTSGTGRRALRVPKAHGKTGTTNNDRNAWFIGYTPELVAAVWVGNDDNSPMKGVWGGNVCCPIWTQFMLKALDVYKRRYEDQGLQTSKDMNRSSHERSRSYHQEEVETPAPQMIRLCSESGYRATPDCPSTYEVPADSVPSSLGRCPLHGTSSNTTESPTGTLNPEGVTPETHTPDTGNPPDPPRANERYVSVTICVDSGQIANDYCPE